MVSAKNQKTGTQKTGTDSFLAADVRMLVHFAAALPVCSNCPGLSRRFSTRFSGGTVRKMSYEE
tara:strand:- start:151 stop:342 length:192 start_codon:yes stop_codon:yes gene_type:complete